MALLLGLLLPIVARADEPARQRQFVYALNVFDGVTYDTSFVPGTVDTIYVMADHDSVVDPKLTEVYFWPITNDYRPDWSSLNQLVPGTLEVSQGGRLVASLQLTPYVVQFDRTNGLPNGKLYLGDEAQQAWARFQGEKSAYVQRLADYTNAMQAFNDKLDEIRKNGGTAPPPPTEPAPFTLYSTEPGQGFALHLAAGRYAIHVRDSSGQVVAGSEKRLVAIAPRRRGVGYEVVPQEKWTTPDDADDPANAIYTVPQGVLYLRPFEALEFNALEYARLKNPQDVEATPNRWTWVHTAPLAGATMRIQDGDAEQRLRLEQFKVEQVPGAALGYRVVPFDPQAGGSPDLVTYRVVAPGARGSLRASLVDANGGEVPGSARELRVNTPVADWQLALPVLVPLAVGLTVTLWRRDQVTSVRALTPEQRQLVA